MLNSIYQLVLLINGPEVLYLCGIACCIFRILEPELEDFTDSTLYNHIIFSSVSNHNLSPMVKFNVKNLDKSSVQLIDVSIGFLPYLRYHINLPLDFESFPIFLTGR